MAELPLPKHTENEAICCCAAGPIFFVSQLDTERAPPPTWSEEWTSLKAVVAEIAMALGYYFSRGTAAVTFGRIKLPAIIQPIVAETQGSREPKVKPNAC